MFQYDLIKFIPASKPNIIEEFSSKFKKKIIYENISEEGLLIYCASLQSVSDHDSPLLPRS